MKRQKRNKIKKLFGLFLAFVMINSVGFSFASAEDEKASMEIPVSQTFSVYNTEPSEISDVFNYSFTAKEEGVPMPDGCSGNVYNFSLKGNGKTVIPDIEYTHAGVYKYTLKQIIPAEDDDYTYDKTVYNIEVHIRNSGEELISDLIVYSDSYKSKEIIFKNSYTGAAATKPTNSTDDNSNPVQTGESSDVPVLVCGATVSMFLIIFIKRKKQTQEN